MFAYLPERGEASGYAVVTPRFACLLGSDATAEIARSIFWLLDGPDAQLQDALGTLSHIDKVDRFAIVELLDASATELRVSALGEVSVGIDGVTTARASGSVLTTSATGVRASWFSLEGGRPEGDLLPLHRGIARATALVTGGPSAPSVDAAEFAVDAEPEPEPQAEQPETQPDVAPEPEQQAAPEAPTGRWVLHLPDGSEVEASRTIIIGRDEWAAPDDGDLIRHVSVPSPKKQISGDHLELALVGDELVARDLDSTNGTIVITQEQPPRLLHNGETTPLQAGDILDLGESLQIVVSNR